MPSFGGSSGRRTLRLDASLRQRLHDPDAGTLVGGFDDHVLGVLLLDRRQVAEGRAIARITFVFVEPEARHIGIGEALIDAVVAWARAAGAPRHRRHRPARRPPHQEPLRAFGLKARALVTYRALGP